MCASLLCTDPGLNMALTGEVGPDGGKDERASLEERYRARKKSAANYNS